jgi:hypothetical protein
VRRRENLRNVERDVMSDRQVERLRSEELDSVMARVQELLEASVLAMIVRHPNGDISVTCPPRAHAEVLEILRTYDWSKLP